MNKQRGLLQKDITVVVIFLLLSIAFTPLIYAKDVSKDNDLVDITIEICGLNGEKHTVQLSKEEAEDVEKIFENISIRIKESNSREEVDEIFKLTVVELDKYGLLGGLSIKQAQNLVVINWRNKIEQRIIDTFYYRFFGNSDDYDNANCQIYGKITNSLYFNYWVEIIAMNWAKNHGYVWTPAFLSYILGTLFRVFPIKLASFIAIGWSDCCMDTPIHNYPSRGEIWTNGTEGVKEWYGSLKGMFYEFTFGDFISGMLSDRAYIGVKLFRGFSYKSLIYTKFFGYAREVKIEYWDP